MIMNFLQSIDWVSFLYGYLLVSAITVLYCNKGIKTFFDIILSIVAIPVFPFYLLFLYLIGR